MPNEHLEDGLSGHRRSKILQRERFLRIVLDEIGKIISFCIIRYYQEFGTTDRIPNTLQSESADSGINSNLARRNKNLSSRLEIF